MRFTMARVLHIIPFRAIIDAGIELTMNRIVVEKSHDYEDTIDGTQFLYRVASCDVDTETGTLTWDRVIFPAVPCRTADATVMISRARSITSHVRDMSVVGDDVLGLLRDRGVEVIIKE